MAERKVIRCSRKKPSQSENSLSEPESMIFMIRPDCVSPWKDSGSDSTCWKKRCIETSRFRCDMRSASREVATFAAIPVRPTAPQTTSKAMAWRQISLAGRRPEAERTSTTRPNRTGSRNCSPARARAEKARPIATHLSGARRPSTLA